MSNFPCLCTADQPVATATTPDGATTVGTDALRLACCDSPIRRLVTNGSTTLDLGRTTRLVTPAQRLALEIRGGGCVFPGCHRPPGWCDAHHLVSWLDGGNTDLANLALRQDAPGSDCAYWADGVLPSGSIPRRPMYNCSSVS